MFLHLRSNRQPNSTTNSSPTRCILRIALPVAIKMARFRNRRWSSKNSHKRAREVKSKVQMLSSSASRPLRRKRERRLIHLRAVLDVVPTLRWQMSALSSSATARVRRVTPGRQMPRLAAQIRVVSTILPGSRNLTWSLRLRSPSSLAFLNGTALDKSPPMLANCALTMRNSGS